MWLCMDNHSYSSKRILSFSADAVYRTHPTPLPATPPPSPIPCGNSTVYCPAGSSTPIVASFGNYTFGGASAAGRIAEDFCPKGRYCQEGVAVLCSAGTFGDREGLQDAACSGPCPAGKQENVGALACDDLSPFEESGVQGNCFGLRPLFHAWGIESKTFCSAAL